MDEFEIITSILTIVFGATTLYFGGKYKRFKSVLRLFIDMIEDDKITEEELKKFVNELKKLYSELVVEHDNGKDEIKDS